MALDSNSISTVCGGQAIDKWPEKWNESPSRNFQQPVLAISNTETSAGAELQAAEGDSPDSPELQPRALWPEPLPSTQQWPSRIAFICVAEMAQVEIRGLGFLISSQNHTPVIQTAPYYRILCQKTTHRVFHPNRTIASHSGGPRPHCLTLQIPHSLLSLLPLAMNRIHLFIFFLLSFQGWISSLSIMPSPITVVVSPTHCLLPWTQPYSFPLLLNQFPHLPFYFSKFTWVLSLRRCLHMCR